MSDWAPSPESLTVASEEHRAVGDVLQGLGDIDRHALILASHGYRGAEIARSIGRTDLATRTLLCRARAKVRARMLASQPGFVRPPDGRGGSRRRGHRPRSHRPRGRRRRDGPQHGHRYHRGAVVDGLERTTLIGRRAEEARLVAALDAAEAGRGSTVIVGGEAGIGKSRLVGLVAETARERGATVLGGACLPAGSGAIPYAPFVEALRGLTRSVEPARLAALLGPARNEVARLLPEVGTRTDAAPTRLEFDRAGQTRLFEAVLSIIERQARSGPVVLVIEDIQWADDGTRGLLGFLSRNLRNAPALLLVTFRTGELGRRDPALAFVAELERDEWVARIDLRGLDRGDVVALLRALGPATIGTATVDERHGPDRRQPVLRRAVSGHVGGRRPRPRPAARTAAMSWWPGCPVSRTTRNGCSVPPPPRVVGSTKRCWRRCSRCRPRRSRTRCGRPSARGS